MITVEWVYAWFMICLSPSNIAKLQFWWRIALDQFNLSRHDSCSLNLPLPSTVHRHVIRLNHLKINKQRIKWIHPLQMPAKQTPKPWSYQAKISAHFSGLFKNPVAVRWVEWLQDKYNTSDKRHSFGSLSGSWLEPINKLPNIVHGGNKPMDVRGSFSTSKLNYTSPDVKNRTMVNPRLDLISIQFRSNVFLRTLCCLRILPLVLLL